MPFISRWANHYASTLTAAVTTTTATTISVTSAAGLPSLTVPTGAVPAVTAVLVGSEIMYVTAISGTTLTVARGQEGTTATTHASGAAVTAVVSRDTLYNNSAAGAVRTTLATGSPTYTVDLTYKYHFIFLPTTALTAWTIGVPTTTSSVPLQGGDEVRLWIKQPATGMTTVQPTWGTASNSVYDRIQTGGTTLRTVATTANSVTSFSFAWDGNGTAPGAAGSWHLIS